MGWKNWPYWVSVILLIILSSLIIVSSIHDAFFFDDSPNVQNDLYSNITNINFSILFYISLIIYFIVIIIGWKEWPFWIKGGIITSGIITIFFIFLHFDFIVTSENLSRSYGDFLFGFSIFLSAVIPFLLYEICFMVTLSSCVPDKLPLLMWFLSLNLFTLSLLLSSFLIGAFIGWLYGKIKNRNQSQLNKNI